MSNNTKWSLSNGDLKLYYSVNFTNCPRNDFMQRFYCIICQTVQPCCVISCPMLLLKIQKKHTQKSIPHPYMYVKSLVLLVIWVFQVHMICCKNTPETLINNKCAMCAPSDRSANMTWLKA